MAAPVNGLTDFGSAPGAAPTNTLLYGAQPILQPGADNPLTALAPTPADAWQHNAGAYQDFVARERASGVAAGTIDPIPGGRRRRDTGCGHGKHANGLPAGNDSSGGGRCAWVYGLSRFPALV